MPMLGIVILFLTVSLLLFVLLGGADFGAGIAHAFSGKKYSGLIYKAVAPLLAINHIWLIMVAAIIYVGFPDVFSLLITELHIPLLLILLGIHIRGAAFFLRRYSQRNKTATTLFQFTGIFTPLLLGMVAGALIEGQINPAAENFTERFILSWLSPFTLAMGVFTCALFTFIACTFLVGDASKSYARHSFIELARKALVATVLAGLLVFGASIFSETNLFLKFNFSPISIICILAATVMLPILWRSLNRSGVWVIRFLTSLQVTFIFLGWFAVQFPVAVYLKKGPPFSFYGTVAPPATLETLVWALIIGSLLILPALFYLIKVSKLTAGKNKTPDS